MSDFEKFCKEFNIIDNALCMRNLLRWNGRDIKKENLSEHTHLVVACVIQLLDELPFHIKEKVKILPLMKGAMIHDSLELLRGDILSITKDKIPYLREIITSEEREFMLSLNSEVTELELELIELADLLACYKFVEFELRNPSNDFALTVYFDTKRKYSKAFKAFKIKYEFDDGDDGDYNEDVRLTKGYRCDAGIDVVLNKDITLMPHKTTIETLDLSVTPDEGEMAILIARTSSAIKGVSVASCPIDSNYSGKISAIITNNSNSILSYKKGDSIFQIVFLPINYKDLGQTVKMNGKRSTGKWGSTDGSIN